MKSRTIQFFQAYHHRGVLRCLVPAVRSLSRWVYLPQQGVWIVPRVVPFLSTRDRLLSTRRLALSKSHASCSDATSGSCWSTLTWGDVQSTPSTLTSSVHDRMPLPTLKSQQSEEGSPPHLTLTRRHKPAPLDLSVAIKRNRSESPLPCLSKKPRSEYQGLPSGSPIELESSSKQSMTHEPAVQGDKSTAVDPSQPWIKSELVLSSPHLNRYQCLTLMRSISCRSPQREADTLV